MSRPPAAARLRLAARLRSESYIAHCTAALAYLIPDEGTPRRLRQPLLLLTTSQLHILEGAFLRSAVTLDISGAVPFMAVCKNLLSAKEHSMVLYRMCRACREICCDQLAGSVDGCHQSVAQQCCSRLTLTPRLLAVHKVHALINNNNIIIIFLFYFSQSVWASAICLHSGIMAVDEVIMRG